MHFSIIGINLMPDNPIKHQYNRDITNYMNPYFSQIWTLFAPNPISGNTTILLQFNTFTKGKADTSKWVDIVEPLVTTRKNNFWAPTQRILKNMSSITQNISQTQSDVSEFVQKQDTIIDKKEGFRKVYDKVFRLSSGHITLMQYSTYVYKKVYPIQKFDSVFVKYRIVYENFPRFSKRELNYYDKKNYTYTETRSIFCKLL
jgi:Family of unknown function (DUF5819)